MRYTSVHCLGHRGRPVKSYRSDQFFQWVDRLSSPYFPSKQHFSFAKPLTVLGRSAARTGRGRGTRSSRPLTGSTAGERRTCAVRVRRGKNECLRSDNLGFCGLVAPGDSATPKGGMSSCGDWLSVILPESTESTSHQRLPLLNESGACTDKELALQASQLTEIIKRVSQGHTRSQVAHGTGIAQADRSSTASVTMIKNDK